MIFVILKSWHWATANPEIGEICGDPGIVITMLYILKCNILWSVYICNLLQL